MPGSAPQTRNSGVGITSGARSMASAMQPSSQSYFFGRISRDEAETLLSNNGCQEGLFLLRESMTTMGNFALSICHQGRVHHYSIERQPDGMVMIQDGKKFVGPIELVQHHKTKLDGFLTKPIIECKRPEGYPKAYPGVTYLELERRLMEAANAKNLRGAQLEYALGPQRQYFVAQIARTLHTEQPWFHGRIERDEADRQLTIAGHEDGKYLVRERDDHTFALSLSYHRQTKHYKIDRHPIANNDYQLAIEDGPRFPSLMDMIAHYHNKTDGLLCKLITPCVRRNYKKSSNRGTDTDDRNPAYGLLPSEKEPVMGATDGGLPFDRRRSIPLPPTPSDSSKSSTPRPFRPELANASWDEPPEGPEGSVSEPRSRPPSLPPDDDLQKIYDVVPRTEDVFNLNKRDLELVERLGAGNFGAVMKGVYRRSTQQIPVAVKTLKHDDLPNAETEIMKEARLMANLQHRNIVRLIGVCKSDMIMLVMELAPLGPLNKYLRRKELYTKQVLELMFQVAEGMHYLESKNFVHRDLAARNVLLVNDAFAKISDFGMSKALGLGNEYYKAESAGKWPLKWYAPECIYFFRFDSKSDVWSYGVTLWEAMSYGQKPYKGLRGQQILEKIEQGARLERPDKCPPGVYDVMMRCWSYDKSERPTFKEIVELLRKHCR